jgi:hypothetical protein
VCLEGRETAPLFFNEDGEMKKATKSTLENLFRLFRFIVLYGAALIVVILVMPAIGSLLEAQYEALSGTVKVAFLSGFFAVIAIWQGMRQRERVRRR